MVVDALHKVFIENSRRVLFIDPYENQVRLIFKRIRELINESPYLKEDCTITFNPYELKVKSTKSSIMGFTTGASSGNEGASINKLSQYGNNSRIA